MCDISMSTFMTANKWVTLSRSFKLLWCPKLRTLILSPFFVQKYQKCSFEVFEGSMRICEDLWGLKRSILSKVIWPYSDRVVIAFAMHLWKVLSYAKNDNGCRFSGKLRITDNKLTFERNRENVGCKRHSFSQTVGAAGPKAPTLTKTLLKVL